VDERVSLTAVVEAIADIMGDVSRGGVVDRALASRIGGEVQVAVAAAVGTGRISSSTQLVGQQAFWNILSQHLASTSSVYSDQQARQNLLRYVRTGQPHWRGFSELWRSSARVEAMPTVPRIATATSTLPVRGSTDSPV
jgi:hypothetical protein